MALFGGSKKTKTNNTQIANQGANSGNTGTINITDGGAFDVITRVSDDAFDFGEEGFDLAGDVTRNALDTNLDVSEIAIKSSGDAFETFAGGLESLSGSVVKALSQNSGEVLNFADATIAQLADTQAAAGQQVASTIGAFQESVTAAQTSGATSALNKTIYLVAGIAALAVLGPLLARAK